LSAVLNLFDQVRVAECPELQNWKKPRITATQQLALYAVMLLFRLLILVLLFYFARR
jgi:hypothetical protein